MSDHDDSSTTTSSSPAEVPPPRPRRRMFKLDTTAAIRRELRRAINDLEQSGAEPEVIARGKAPLLREAGRLRTDELERQVKELRRYIEKHIPEARAVLRLAR